MVELANTTESVLQAIVAVYHATLHQLPGDKFHMNITGAGDEWRTENVIDYYPAKVRGCDEEEGEDSEPENNYTLVFSLFAGDTNISAIFTLEHEVYGSGVEDRVTLPLDNQEKALEIFLKHVDEWDMHRRHAPRLGTEMIEKVFALQETLKDESIVWTS